MVLSRYFPTCRLNICHLSFQELYKQELKIYIFELFGGNDAVQICHSEIDFFPHRRKGEAEKFIVLEKNKWGKGSV